MKIWIAVGLIVCLAGTARAADDALTTAKGLYASAAYQEALSALDGVDAKGADVAREVDLYKTLCLLALNRKADAEKSAESLITREPLVQLEDLPPRVTSLIDDVRARLLPKLIRDEYRRAKAAFDADNNAEAAPRFAHVRELMTEAQKRNAWNDSLADLQDLVDGFIELNKSSLQPKPAAAAAAGPAAATPVTTPAAATAAAAPPAPAPVRSAATTPQPLIYTDAAADVTAPRAISQRLPTIPPTVRAMIPPGSTKAVLDLVIDESGTVQDAVLRPLINASYNQLIVQAARMWKFTPALRNGAPVKYRKTMIVAVE